MLTVDLKPRSGTDRLADALGALGRGGGSNDPLTVKNAAYDGYVGSLKDAWKMHRPHSSVG
jgi:hypothetical protein